MPFLPGGRVYDPQRLSVITTIVVPVRIPCHYYFQDLGVIHFFWSVCVGCVWCIKYMKSLHHNLTLKTNSVCTQQVYDIKSCIVKPLSPDGGMADSLLHCQHQLNVLF